MELATIIVILFVLFLLFNNDGKVKRKNDVLYKMLNSHDITREVFVKYLNKKAMSKKEMLSSMIEKGEIDGKVARKYWDM